MLITEELIAKAKKLIATGEAEPVGYRIMVKSIFVDTEMELALKDEFETLADIGFQDKTDEQAKKESKGTYFGIVCDLGDHAYKSEHMGGKDWLNMGDVAVFERYAGIGINLPPGTENEYRFMNDESILGRMVPEQKED